MKFLLGMIVGGILSPLLLVGGLYGYSKLTSGGESKLSAPVLPTMKADYDWDMTTVAGDPVSFGDFEGKTVFLTFWKPNCGTCRSELPYVQALYETIEHDDIAFAMVAIDETDDWLGFIAEHGLTFPIYVAEDYPDMYRTGTVPSTFILSPDGTVAARFRGVARWDDDSSVNFLRGLALSSPGEGAPQE